MSSSSDIIKAILHYQERLERYNLNKSEDKMLYVFRKLSKLPIKTSHLESTGVGRTVNALKKLGGEVGEAAKNLVNTWKDMVLEEEKTVQEVSLEAEDADSVYSSENENRDCDQENLSKETESSHSNTDENESEGYSSKKEVPNKSDGYLEKKSNKHIGNNKKSNRNNYKTSSSSGSSNSDEERTSKCDKYNSRKRSHSSDSTSSEREKHNLKKSRKDKEKVTIKDSHGYKQNSSKEDKTRKQQKDDKHLSEKNKETFEKSKKSSSNENSKKHKESSEKSKHKPKRDSDEEARYRSRNELEEKRCTVKRKSTDSYSNQKSEKYRKHEEKNDHKSDKSKKHEEKTDKHSKSSHSSKHKNKESTHLSSSKKNSKENDKNEFKNKEERHSSEKKSKNLPKEENKSDPIKTPKDINSSTSSNNKVTDSAIEEKKNKIKKEKVGKDKIINGIDSESGASFAEALGMCGTVVSSLKKKSTSDKNRHITITDKSVDKNTDHVDTESVAIKNKSKYERGSSNSSTKVVPSLLKEEPPEPLSICLSSLLPEITPNYKPLGVTLDTQPKRMYTDDEALSRVMANKNQRTKVYSGNKTVGKVESLFQICVRVLQDNIDALEYTGGVPYVILKSIMDRATPDQLFNLEHHNPYLIEDTDELWQLHCQKDFRTKKREEMESWRDMYMRCLDEREAKLNAVKANIKLSQDKSIPVRTTKLAFVDSDFVKPPRNIARKQVKNGTVTTDRKATPTQKLSTLAKSGEAEKISVPDPGRRAAGRPSSSSAAAVKPKKAPLMAKTISFLKNRFKR